MFLVIPIVIYLYDCVFVNHPFPQMMQNLPMLLRIAIYLLIGDFGYYRVHNTECIRRLYGELISGITLQLICIGLLVVERQYRNNFLLCSLRAGSTDLYPSPWWVYTALVIFSYLTVDWMHLNVPWGSKWLEWVVVTPRYHRHMSIIALILIITN